MNCRLTSFAGRGHSVYKVESIMLRYYAITTMLFDLKELEQVTNHIMNNEN